jgi:tyrosinase
MYAYPFDFMGEVAYKNVTLDTEMDFWNLLGSTGRYVKISDMMDIGSSNLGYTYQ